MQEKLLISISIVLYNPDIFLLKQVLQRLQLAMKKMTQGRSAEFSLFLIDNSENNEVMARVQILSQELFANDEHVILRFIKSPTNIGYGRANNLAIQQANSTYHIVMNPDVLVEEDSLSNAILYMDAHPNIGLLTPAVYGKDGERHFLCKKNPTLFDMYLRSFAPRFLKQRFHQRITEFEMREKDYDREMSNISYPSGCFMFLRTAILKAINGFDEAYFLHFEDADLGRRLMRVSQSAYVPNVKVVHLWQRRSKRDLKMIWIMMKSGLLYYRKHGGVL